MSMGLEKVLAIKEGSLASQISMGDPSKATPP